MRLLAGSSEAEMIAVFLQAELRSERFGAELAQLLAHDRRDPAIVAVPDLQDLAANLERRRQRLCPNPAPRFEERGCGCAWPIGLWPCAP
jgi:hypothetical protein